jgi:hypothetical protein
MIFLAAFVDARLIAVGSAAGTSPGALVAAGCWRQGEPV